MKAIELYVGECLGCNSRLNGRVAKTRRKAEKLGYRFVIKNIKYNHINALFAKNIGYKVPFIYNTESKKATNELEKLANVL